MGRCGDIVVKGLGISRIHCSFELYEHNKSETMLQDRSSNNSAKVSGPKVRLFQPGRAHRRVIVDEKYNLEIGLGGEARDLQQFWLFWHKRDEDATDVRINHLHDDPRQTRTIPNEPPSTAQSWPVTQVHTRDNMERMRYSV